MSLLGIGISLPNGREHSQCHGRALVYHCPMVENIWSISWFGIGVSLPNGREHSQCQVGHWCIIAQL